MLLHWSPSWQCSCSIVLILLTQSLLAPYWFLIHVWCANAHDTIFNTCLLAWIYRYMCACPCTSFGTHITTRWVAPDNSELVCPDFGAWSAVEPSEEVWWRSGSVVDARSSFLPAFLPIGSRDSSCCSWALLSFWLCIFPCKSYFYPLEM